MFMRKIARHYFTPHEHNNYRSKLLHHSSLVAVVLVLFVSSFFLNTVQKVNPEILGVSYAITQQELLDATNQARAAQGLAPLALNESLVQAANGKAHHMIANNYWAHFAPDGTSPWTFIRGSGYTYVFAGENLAKGFTTSGPIVDAWLNSPSHRENLLSEKYKEIGFAVVEGNLEGEETVLVVQMFGTQDVPAPIAQPQQIAVAPTDTPIKVEITPYVASVTASITPATSPARIVDQAVEYPPQPAVAGTPLSSITPFFLNTEVVTNPMLDLTTPTRAVPILIVGSLLLALLLDIIIIKRKNIPRIVGHNLDHIMILTMFLILLVLERFGVIL
jgi:hypothetical protein